MKKLLLAILIAANSSLLFGCTNKSDSTLDSNCKSNSISAAISKAVAPIDVLVNLDSFECANNFAYAFATIGPVDGNIDGRISVTMVFKYAEAMWKVQDRSKVCGTAIYDGETVGYPKDALVPKAIWQNACQTN